MFVHRHGYKLVYQVQNIWGKLKSINYKGKCGGEIGNVGQFFHINEGEKQEESPCTDFNIRKALTLFFLCIFKSFPSLNQQCLTFSHLVETYIHFYFVASKIRKAQYRLYWPFGF
jgi:hypothetical protein